MRISAILTTLCLVAWSVPGAQAENSGAIAASPAEPVAPAPPAAALNAPVAPAAMHDTTHTPPAEGSAQKPATTAAAVQEVQPAAAAEEDPLICRSRVETGTLGRKQKICMTKSQWLAQKEAARRYMKGINQSRAAQGGGETLPGG